MIEQLTWRYRLMQIFLGLMGFIVIFQIIRIQNSPEAIALKETGETYTGTWKSYSPVRGLIYDRDGRLLVGNQTVYEVGVDLNLVNEAGNVEDIANRIAMTVQVHLGLDYADAYEQILHPEEGIVYAVLADFVSADRVGELERFLDTLEGTSDGQKLSALVLNPHLERTYPEKTMASNLLGFVTREGHGFFGVEGKYDSRLAGTPVTVWVPADPNQAQDLPQIPPGESLVLTIKSEVQAATEQVLDSAIQTYGAESGTIVVMDPKTGEILAMATTPRLDPNEYWKYVEVFPGETPYNRAIGEAYEPGSVAKILTMAAALDKGLVQPTTPFYDVGQIIVGGVRIINWDGKAYGPQDMVGCLQHSLNVCLAWVGTQLGNQDFYDYMQKFGLGHPTGIDLDGETSGRLKLPGDGDWYPVDLGVNSFGQGVSVTPIQMVMAASALANGGKMVYPHVVYATIQDGVQRNVSTQIVGTPISPTTASVINDMLSVSLENETSLALVPGYLIAGKTGTAEIPTSSGYSSNQTNASFIGWAPVDDPQFLVYVWLKKPSTSIWGSETAAPVFKQMVQKLVVLLGIPPDQVRQSQMSGQ